jgi:hypothetical protein
MGGTIWLESDLGRGSTFHFTARFARVADAAATIDQRRLEPLRSLRVLIVDDNATNRRIVGELLMQWKMAPDAVTGAAEGFAALSKALTGGIPTRSRSSTARCRGWRPPHQTSEAVGSARRHSHRGRRGAGERRRPAQAAPGQDVPEASRAGRRGQRSEPPVRA